MANFEVSPNLLTTFRLDAAEETEGLLPVVRLEHLPPFTERWTPEALTPHILSQVGWRSVTGTTYSRCCLPGAGRKYLH